VLTIFAVAYLLLTSLKQFFKFHHQYAVLAIDFVFFVFWISASATSTVTRDMIEDACANSDYYIYDRRDLDRRVTLSASGGKAIFKGAKLSAKKGLDAVET
jgi:hypothetical protein